MKTSVLDFLLTFELMEIERIESEVDLLEVDMMILQNEIRRELNESGTN